MQKRLTITRTVDPSAEPVSVDEAKSHLRVDITDDDTLIGTLITAARDYVEQTTRRALVTQTWQYFLDDWPGISEIVLPKPPLQSVTSVVYTDSDGNDNTWSSSEYAVDTDNEPGAVVLGYNESYPSGTLDVVNPITVTYVAGYGAAAAVPWIFKQAILLLVGHWYENREAIVLTGAVPKEIPLAVKSLLLVDRVW